MPSPERENGPQEDPSNDPNVLGAMRRILGEMEDDRSRRRRPNRRPQPEEEDLQLDCLMKNKPKTTFDDIAGNEEAVDEMREIAKAVRDPEAYQLFGAHLPKGILMCGIPGCGKTYMTGALSNSLNAPFYHVQVSNITSMWFGESEKNLQKIFSHAKRYCRGEIDINEEGEVSVFNAEQFAENRMMELMETTDTESSNSVQTQLRTQIREELQTREQELQSRYALIFFDEIDALGASRDNTPFQGGVSNRIVSVLLENMDGLESGDRLVVVASTNRPEAVDPALRRAGRFDRILKIKRPDQNTRAKIFDIHFHKAEEKAGREFAEVNTAELATKTKKMVGADIAEIVRKSCQEQAKKYREATDEEKETQKTLRQELVLEVVGQHRSSLRKKDPDEKGPIGFCGANQEAMSVEGDLE